MNPMSYTEKRVWAENNFGMEMVERLIISPNKSLLKGEYLIDDNISGKGREGFEGGILQYGSAQYLDWSTIISELEKSCK